MKKIWEQMKKNKYFKPIMGFLILIVFVGIVYMLFIRGHLQFQKNEKAFLEGVQKYYEYNPTKLPNEGGYREVKLSNMFQESWVESLYVPGKNRLCDGDSFVRVIRENDEYRYITYLKCGKYETKVDHKSPEIVLNGDDTVVIHLNDEYQDSGVQEVRDDTDKIDVANVLVDTSKINVRQMGTYEVTYKVYDNSYNVATKKRTVVVADTLSAHLQREKGANYVYTGASADNYVMFSGMTWRILKLDGDGNIALITDDNISNVFYSQYDVSYPESNVYKWLNEYFYSNISGNSQKYIVDHKWCYDTMSDVSQMDLCNESVQAKVGLLSLGDYERTKVEGRSYLLNSLRFSMINKYDDRNVWISELDPNSRPFKNIKDSVGIRPVIYIGKDIFTTAGNGTENNPYKLQDYTYAKENDLLNTRLIGEYVMYSGHRFRISGTDKEGNIKLVGVDILTSGNDSEIPTIQYAKETTNFTPDVNQEGNIYYDLNQNAINYISETSIVSHEFEIPVYHSDKNFDAYERKKIKAKLSLPASYEMFSGLNSAANNNFIYWLSDYTEDGICGIVNGDNGLAFHMGCDIYPSNTIKPVIYVNKDLKVASGKGTSVDPYYVR